MVNTEELGKYMSIEQKAAQYDSMLKSYFEMKEKYDEMLNLIHDWALIQHRLEQLACGWRAPLGQKEN